LPCAKSCSSRWPCWWWPRSPCPPARAHPVKRGRQPRRSRPAQLQSANGEYVVAYADGVSAAAARAAIKAAGGTVLQENGKVGVAAVKSSD
jgi:hypothetical protein